MSVTDEDQWIYIKYLCDNQTNCSYPFGGAYFVTDCAPGSQVDYISIYYDCLPGLKISAQKMSIFIHIHLLKIELFCG